MPFQCLHDIRDSFCAWTPYHAITTHRKAQTCLDHGPWYSTNQSTVSGQIWTNESEALCLRSEVTFPSCWDGRLDTEDMAADPHVVYPSPSWRAGVCPESHSKRLPTVFFEALFRPGGVYQPGDQLYYSFNDTTGYGFHGDFFNGWQDGLIDVSNGNDVVE